MKKQKKKKKFEVDYGVGKESEWKVIKLTVVWSMLGSRINKFLLTACGYCQHFASTGDGLLGLHGFLAVFQQMVRHLRQTVTILWDSLLVL